MRKFKTILQHYSILAFILRVKELETLLCKQYVSFKPGGSKQPKGLFHASSLETIGQKEVAIFTLWDVIRVGSAGHVQLIPDPSLKREGRKTT
ncbi:MAG: hypothetical protein WAT21_04495 [Saprospiraceae bacterium]